MAGNSEKVHAQPSPMLSLYRFFYSLFFQGAIHFYCLLVFSIKFHFLVLRSIILQPYSPFISIHPLNKWGLHFSKEYDESFHLINCTKKSHEKQKPKFFVVNMVLKKETGQIRSTPPASHPLTACKINQEHLTGLGGEDVSPRPTAPVITCDHNQVAELGDSFG